MILEHDMHEWEITRWWRVIADDSDKAGLGYQIWCETSDEKEARRALATCPYPARLKRLHRCVAEQWMEET